MPDLNKLAATDSAGRIFKELLTLREAEAAFALCIAATMRIGLEVETFEELVAKTIKLGEFITAYAKQNQLAFERSKEATASGIPDQA